MLASGEFVTIAELAQREGTAVSYLTRVLRVTLLAPDTVEAILKGTLGPEVTLAGLMGADSGGVGGAGSALRVTGVARRHTCLAGCFFFAGRSGGVPVHIDRRTRQANGCAV